MPLTGLSSGVVANKEQENDLLNVCAVGEKCFKKFLEERVLTTNVPFYEPIKRNNLRTFGAQVHTKKVKVNDRNVSVKADRQTFGRLLIYNKRCLHGGKTTMLYLNLSGH